MKAGPRSCTQAPMVLCSCEPPSLRLAPRAQDTCPPALKLPGTSPQPDAHPLQVPHTHPISQQELRACGTGSLSGSPSFTGKSFSFLVVTEPWDPQAERVEGAWYHLRSQHAKPPTASQTPARLYLRLPALTLPDFVLLLPLAPSLPPSFLKRQAAGLLPITLTGRRKRMLRKPQWRLWDPSLSYKKARH